MRLCLQSEFFWVQAKKRSARWGLFLISRAIRENSSGSKPLGHKERRCAHRDLERGCVRTETAAEIAALGPSVSSKDLEVEPSSELSSLPAMLSQYKLNQKLI